MFVILSVLSCNRQKAYTPEVLLSESQMIDIMTDVQIIEADINSQKTKGLIIGDEPSMYYNQLFKHYGITDNIFSQNLKYYTLDPTTLEKIMDSVTNRLLKAQENSNQ